jgi:hypothetical protein
VRISPARWLILLYGLLLASGYVYLAFADDASIGGNGRGLWIVISALIILGLWKGSAFAWGVSVFLDAFTIFGVIAMGSLGLTPYVLLVLSFGALAILFCPPVRAHVRDRGDTRLASS